MKNKIVISIFFNNIFGISNFQVDNLVNKILRYT